MSWFPRYTSDGTHLLSGAGLLYDHDSPLIEHGEHLVGWNPVPINNRHVLYNGGPGGTRLYDLWTRQSVQMYAGELIELAGGGNKWAGRDASRNVLVLWDGREIPNAGQPCLAQDGALTYRVGDDRIEPSICLTHEAWGDGHGQIIAESRGPGEPLHNVTVGPAEYRPVLIDTPEGPWVLCMTLTALHLRPLFSAEGYTPPADLVGDNRNLHAHAVCVGTTILCVWNDAQGNQIHWRKDLSDPRITLNAVPTTPTPVPEPSMPEPIEAIRTVRAKYPTPLGAQHGAFLVEMAQAIGGGAGLLKKDHGTFVVLPDGTKVSQDIVMYSDGRHYDALSDGEGAAEPAWQFVGHIDPTRFYAVTGGDDPDPGDEDPPLPIPDSEMSKRLDALEKRLERLEGAGLLVAQVYRP